MNKLYDGDYNPPVHPITTKDGLPFSAGITLLDYFAGLAMQADASLEQGFSTKNEERSSWAYDQAESMLEERAKRLGIKEDGNGDN